MILESLQRIGGRSSALIKAIVGVHAYTKNDIFQKTGTQPPAG